MGDRLVDFGVSASAFFVIHLSRVADVGDHEPMLDPVRDAFVQCQPGNRADGPRNEDEPVRIAERTAVQVSRKKGAERHSGKIVVANRRVTNVTGDEHLIGTFPGDQALRIGQVPRFERRVDNHFIQTLLQIIELILAEAKSPALLIVGCLVRNPVGVIGKRIQVLTQFRQRHPFVDGGAVVQNVQT